ncbi:efflux RND transporter periplasmic adaptor subunit [Rhodopirellula sallentina]|nr:efflux RND transporter periplasmic adaptor subunit [Rhodopirellula sallentina]
MPSKLSRIGVSAAGMFVECCIAAAAAWVFLIVDDPLVRSVSHSVVLTAGISTLLFNANVLMRFDGYFILADAVDIPNLASEASQTLERFGKRWIIGESARHGQLSGWRGMLVSVYAVAAIVWRFGVCVCLAITASTLFEGAGILITAVGIAMWVGRPVGRMLQYMGFLARHNVIGFYRGVIIGGGLLAVGLAVVFAFPIPSRVRAPVISRYAATSSIRSPANGFIERVHVRDGQTVQEGTPLVTMRNEELRCQLRQLQAEHDRVAVEKRQAAGELNEGKTHVLRRHAESLQKQIAQIEDRIESLTIRAPNHGRVIARQLDTMIETYVEEGDEIMVVADDTDREWIALITPRHIDRVRACVGENVRLVSSGHRKFTSRLTRIEPRATDRLIEPALASVHGGPLATRQDRDDSDSDQLRMLQPHFHAWLAVVPDASDLPVGMRMFVDCGYRSQTIASRLREWVRSVYEAHQTAQHAT